MATSGSLCVIGEKTAETGCRQTGSLCEHVSQAGGAAGPQGSPPSAEQEVRGGHAQHPVCLFMIPELGQAFVTLKRPEPGLRVAPRDHRARAVLRSGWRGGGGQAGGRQWTLSCSEH